MPKRTLHVHHAFQDWVKKIGGQEKLADKLGCSTHTVKHWVLRRGHPSVKALISIVKLSKGRLTFEDIILSTSRVPLKRSLFVTTKKRK